MRSLRKRAQGKTRGIRTVVLVGAGEQPEGRCMHLCCWSESGGQIGSHVRVHVRSNTHSGSSHATHTPWCSVHNPRVYTQDIPAPSAGMHMISLGREVKAESLLRLTGNL